MQAMEELILDEKSQRLGIEGAMVCYGAVPSSQYGRNVVRKGK